MSSLNLNKLNCEKHFLRMLQTAASCPSPQNAHPERASNSASTLAEATPIPIALHDQESSTDWLELGQAAFQIEVQ